MMSILLMFLLVIVPFSVKAEGPATPTADVAATSYVVGAINSVESKITTKQNILQSENVVISGSGNTVTNITASNGVLTVEKSTPTVNVPVGSANSTTTVPMWLE